jgi:DNA-binding transcriptional ArsR family regulator
LDLSISSPSRRRGVSAAAPMIADLFMISPSPRALWSESRIGGSSQARQTLSSSIESPALPPQPIGDKTETDVRFVALRIDTHRPHRDTWRMGTLRIHFSAEDVARTHLAARAHPLWEIVGSLHRLQTRDGYASYETWHRRVRRDVQQPGLAEALRSRLLPIVPLRGYFPDFLTPGLVVDLDEGIDQVLGTDPVRIGREIRMLGSAAGAAPWLTDLAAGRPAALAELGSALRSYFHAAVAPYWTEISSTVASDRALRGAKVMDHGAGRLLEDLSPVASWEPPVLCIRGYPRSGEIRLGGRGLTLVPSYFCWRSPIMLANPELPPTLLYPARRHRDEPQPSRGRKLAPLIGSTRSAVLRATAHGATTCEIARRVGISPATASHHTTVLREAGLIDSQRHGNLVLHRLSHLGAALIDNHRAESTSRSP